MHSSGDGFEHYGQRPYQEFATRRKMFRKRKLKVGNAFVEELDSELQDLDRARREDSGLYCRACKKRRSWWQVHSKYEKQGTDWHCIWSCDQCGAMLTDRNLDDR